MTDKERLQTMIKNKKITLLELANQLGNVSRSCQMLGYSRQQYYNIKKRYLQEGEKGLNNRSRRPKRHPWQATEMLEKRVLDWILKYPSYSYQRVSGTLFVEEGILVTENQVRGIFRRHRLARFKDRLKYLEQEHQKQGFVLTEEQIELLSRFSERPDYQHVNAPHAGYLLSQDTFFVGCLKGVGKVYLQTVIDCANSFGFAKLYTGKDALVAAHMLQDRVLPFYERMAIPIHAILTDNGSEYCGLEDHPYETMLWLFNIRHRRTRVKSPQTNGFVERFHQTLLTEFFQKQFRIKYYDSIEQLQEDLDKFLVYYNFRRSHQGYRLGGRTPFQGMISNQFALALPETILN